MFKKAYQFALLGALCSVSQVFAQEMPLVYDQENTGADCPAIYTPFFGELPETSFLPDPFEWSDGRGRIVNKSDWRCRRNEIATEIQKYEIGTKAAPPENIEASFSNNTLSVTVTVNGESLTLSSAINLPEGDGPHPVLIGMGFNPIPDSLTRNRDIATMSFSHDQVTSYSGPSTNDPYYRLYPEFNPSNTGQYSAWTWGVSRLIDGLEMISEEANIDVQHVAVSGCSYAGKMAIFSGAFDERVALTFGIESGGGGYTTWRYSEVLNRVESVETLGKTDYNWFKDDMNQFANNVDKLPMDHHELMAMVAPRALFVTGNPGWTWLADESGYVGSNATKKVYEALGIADRFAYSQIGGHNHCAIPSQQVPEIVAFLDRFMNGNDEVATNVATSPYTTSLNPWMPWQAPVLGNDTSFLATTALVSPEDNASGLDTTLTFSWDALDDAQLYYFEISTSPTFQNVLYSDSLTNTELTVDGLVKGKKHFWRVQVKNSEGQKGAWSYPYSLITFISLPGKPALNEPTIIRPSRPNFFGFSWSEDTATDSYQIQVSESPEFTPITATATTSENSNTVTILRASEGDTYYWRVRGRNIAGEGEWSDVASFYVFAQPDDLDSEILGTTVALDWDDNSDIEEGYIIERKYDDGEFAIIDTVGADEEEYVDTTPEFNSGVIQYRIRGYEGINHSSYSNTTEIILVGTEEEREVPLQFSIQQNYPNPFNPSTLIEFSLPQTVRTRLSVYDVLGREVAILLNEVVQAGSHTVQFNAQNIPSGVYLYQIQAGAFSATRKMILMK